MSRRTFRLRAACGLALLLVGFLVVLLSQPTIAAPPTAAASGDAPSGPHHILRVPADHATIQAAIDAAAEGDEIWITGDDYNESLLITKSLTLVGSWNSQFTYTTTHVTHLDAAGLGRGITISGTHPGMAVDVSRFFIYNGDATGLGGVEIGGLETGLPEGRPDGSRAQNEPPLAPADAAREVRSRVADLAGQGRLPGGTAAAPALLARLDSVLAGAESGAAAGAPPAALAGPADCGGGIYVRGAALHLHTAVLGELDTPNTASRTGRGAGGGLCAADVPAGGLRIEEVWFRNNTAGANNGGLGGGLFISGTVAGAVRLQGFSIYNNAAGRVGDGYGGGIFLYGAPDAIINSGTVYDNAASAGQGSGYGGGLALMASPRAQVVNTTFIRNTGAAGWAPVGKSLIYGRGGGAFVADSDGVTFGAGCQFGDNLAVLHGQGRGGGLDALRGQGLRVDGAIFDGNWANVYPIQFQGGITVGGGISLDGVTGVQIDGTTLHGNVTILSNGMCQMALGGALAGMGVVDMRLQDSTIQDNTSSTCGGADRPVASGAVGLVGASQYVTITHNTFAGNVAESADFMGLGGALYFQEVQHALVSHNSFERNIAGMGGGIGGALAMEAVEDNNRDVAVDGNRFAGNRAAGANGEIALGGAIGLTSTLELRITNNVLSGNSAGHGAGLFLGSGDRALTQAAAAQVINNTFYANDGSAVALRLGKTPGILTNNIVVSHTVGIEIDSGATVAAYTLYNANETNAQGDVLTETHVITGPVNFVDPTAGDLRLRLTSAARDAGDPAGAPPAPSVDIDGTPRPFGPRVDIGAYEWHGARTWLPLAAQMTRPQRSGWAIGDHMDGTAAIIHTVDGGLHWSVQGDSRLWPGLNGVDISAVDDQTAWAAIAAHESTAGLILHTTDGGTTWVTQTLPFKADDGMKGVKGLSRQEAWAASLHGTILHTTDAGTTWRVVPHPGAPITQVNRIDALGQDVWLADADTGGSIVHSPDGGATWRRELLPNDSPLIVHTVSRLVTWASGTQGPSWYRTLDGGATWKLIVPGNEVHLDDLCATGPETVWAAENRSSTGAVLHLRTTDDPPVSDRTPSGIDGYEAEGITCLNDQVVWAVWMKTGEPESARPLGLIFYTEDGEHWVQQPAPADVKWWKISFVGARR